MTMWADIATLVKTKNLKGGFVVRSTAGLPFILSEGMSVSFVPPTLDGPRQAQIQEVTMLDEQTAHVRFQGIDSIQIAETLIGSHCLVEKSELPVLLDLETQEEQTLQGYELYDKKSDFVGLVVDVINNRHQVLLVAKTSDKEVLIPQVDGIITRIDHEAKVIEASLPEGLLEL